MPERKQQRSITMPSDMALSSLAVMNNGATAVLGSWDNCVYVPRPLPDLRVGGFPADRPRLWACVGMPIRWSMGACWIH